MLILLHCSALRLCQLFASLSSLAIINVLVNHTLNLCVEMFLRATEKSHAAEQRKQKGRQGDISGIS